MSSAELPSSEPPVSATENLPLPIIAGVDTEARPETASGWRIAGFWRRFAAGAVDALLLMLVGAVLGLFLADFFVRLWPWGRFVGFGVAMVYFGLGDSRLTGGQTLGKFLLGIRIVGTDGRALAGWRATLRYLLPGAVWTINNAPFVKVDGSWAASLASVVLFGGGLSLLYLLIFNRRTRQSLHDLLTNAYVVRAVGSGPVRAPAVWRGHLVVCAGLCVVAALAPIAGERWLSQAPWSWLLRLEQQVRAEPWVENVQIKQSQTVFTPAGGKSQHPVTSLQIAAQMREENTDDEARAARLATLALASDPAVDRLDLLTITLAHGYDIGVDASWHFTNWTYPPAEWRRRRVP